MSITKLKSSVIEKGTSVDGQEDSIIDGIYGTKGFYFQQRRGRLDLRGLAQIDLERVVRDVDVDILQMHLENITFCNLREEDLRFITDQHVVKLFRVAQLIIEYLLYAQEQLSSNLNSLASKYAAKKRSLISKRKELEELQENSKVLRAQLRSKKKGIKTLETLLKDASSREHTRTRKKNKELPIEAPPVVNEKPKPPFMKLYISGPNGWCIELNTRYTSTISDLKKDIKQAFVNKKDIDEEYGSDPTINLLYQGRVLLNDSAIEDIDDLKYGDTIVAHIEKLKIKKGNEETKVQPEPRANALSNKEIMEFITRQHEISSNEMREGWQNLIQTLCMTLTPKADTNSRPDLSLLDDRLSSIEKSMRDQLNSQYLEMKNAFSQLQSRKLIVGDLESDNDDRILSREELERKLRASYDRIKGLEDKVDLSELSQEDLKRLQRRQAEEINELRRLLQERNNNSTPTFIIQNTTPTPVIQQAPRRIKKVARSPSPQEPVIQPIEAPKPAEKYVQISKPEPEPIAVPIDSPKPAAVKAPKPQTKISAPIVNDVPRLTKVYFSPILNPGLLQFGLKDGIEISILEKSSPNDVVFELRRKIAERAGIPLPRISLNLSGKSISLGIDVDETFTPSLASDMAENGELLIEFRDTITDSQIDLLMNQWEKSPYLSDTESPRSSFDTKASRSSKITEAPIQWKDRNSLRQREEFYRKTLSESKKLGYLNVQDFEDEEEEESMDNLKKSLGSVLQELSDKERLTDDEYQDKLNKLQSSLKDVPVNISARLRSFHDTAAGDVNQAINSGSEDYSSSDGFRRRKTGVATLRLSSSQQSMRLSQEGRKKKRDYDTDEDFTLTGSISQSIDFQEHKKNFERNTPVSLRASNQTRRYSDDDDDDEKSDRRGSLQYTRDSLSIRGFDDTIDSNLGKSVGRSSLSSSRPRYDGSNDSGDEDNRSAFDLAHDDAHEEKSQMFGDTNTHSAGTFSSDLSHDHDIDFNQTIVTDISGPGENVEDRADAYERTARETLKMTPTTPQNLTSSARPMLTASSRGTTSPFDAMTSDFDDDGSLELSQSNEVFGNYMEPPRSAMTRFREEK